MKPVEILLYSDVYFGDAEKYVTSIIAAGKSPILFRINSSGGSVFDGYAIYNALLAHKPGVTVQIDGMAASIASLIAMAATKIIFAANAMMMIHNPSMGGGGDANELRKKAALLDEIKVSLVAAYMRRIGDKLTADQLNTMLDAETWLTAEAAQKLGMCDEITSPVDAQNFAGFDTSKFRNLPQQLKNQTPQNTMFKLTASVAALLATASGNTITADTSEADVISAINALSGKLTTATGQVTALTTERDAIQAQFTALTTSVDAIKAERDAANGKLTSLTAERDGFKAQLGTAENRVKNMEALCGVKGINPDAAPQKLDDPGHQENVYQQWAKASGAEKTKIWREHRDEIRQLAPRQ